MQTSQFLKKRGSLLLSTLLFTTLILPLSTVGFVSFQDYKKDAQAAIIRENIGLLTSALNTQWASQSNIATLINTGSVDKTVQVSSQKIIFWETDSSHISTKAGDIEWSNVTWIASDDMRDLSEYIPLVGYAETATNSALQVATTIDSQVYVKGNFTPDAGGNAAKWLIQNPSGASELVDGDYGKHR